MLKRLALLAVLFLTLPVSSSARADAHLTSFAVTASGGVFATVGQQGSPGGGHIVWPVTLDLGLFGTLPTSVVLNFPDRASVTLTRMRSESRGAGAFLWTGRGRDCSAMFRSAAVGFRGVISCLNAPYGIDLAPDGSGLQLTRFDKSSTSTSKTSWELQLPTFTPPATPSQAPAWPVGQPPDTAIDILVLYTEAVRQHFDPSGGNANTVAFMRDCVDYTQMAMDNSTTAGQSTIAQVNFVAAKEVSRTASGDLGLDVSYLQTDPEPVGLRNFWAADVLMYLTVDGGNSAGSAPVPGSGGFPVPGPAFANDAVAALQFNYAIQDESGQSPQEPFVFAHEFAHNLGANHDPANSNNSTPLNPWAFGHW